MHFYTKRCRIDWFIQRPWKKRKVNWAIKSHEYCWALPSTHNFVWWWLDGFEQIPRSLTSKCYYSTIFSLPSLQMRLVHNQRKQEPLWRFVLFVITFSFSPEKTGTSNLFWTLDPNVSLTNGIFIFYWFFTITCICLLFYFNIFFKKYLIIFPHL